MAVDAVSMLEALVNMTGNLMSLAMINNALRILTQYQQDNVGRRLKQIDEEAYRILSTTYPPDVRTRLTLILTQATSEKRPLTERAIERSREEWHTLTSEEVKRYCEQLSNEKELAKTIYDYVENVFFTPFVLNWSAALSGARDYPIVSLAGPCTKIAQTFVAGRLLLKWAAQYFITLCGRWVTLPEDFESKVASLIVPFTAMLLNVTRGDAEECATDLQRLEASAKEKVGGALPIPRGGA